MVHFLRYCCLWAALWSLAGCGDGTKSAQSNMGEAKVDSSLKVQVAFPGVDYSRAVAYAYDGKNGASVAEKGVLNSTIQREKELSTAEIQRFLDILNKPQSYGGTGARCFMPHLGVVFYNAANEIVAQVSICLLCNNLVAMPELEATKLAKSGAFSEAGRAAIEVLNKEWALSAN